MNEQRLEAAVNFQINMVKMSVGSGGTNMCVMTQRELFEHARDKIGNRIVNMSQN